MANHGYERLDPEDEWMHPHAGLKFPGRQIGHGIWLLSLRRY